MDCQIERHGAEMITTGIVPGFPASWPAHLDQAWLAIVSKPRAASIATTDGDGVRITLKRQTKKGQRFAVRLVHRRITQGILPIA
jgi:hypothetical protein